MSTETSSSKAKQIIDFISRDLVVIFATSGILSNQADPNRSDGPVPQSVKVLTWIILGVASIQLVLRLIIVTYRYRTQRLFKGAHQPTGQNEAVATKNNN